MFTIQWMPNLSVTMPNVSPHGAFASGSCMLPPAGIAISLSGEDESELRGYWDKLSDGGMTIMPLEKAPWGDTFGMSTDRFGISWMVNIAGAQS